MNKFIVGHHWLFTATFSASNTLRGLSLAIAWPNRSQLLRFQLCHMTPLPINTFPGGQTSKRAT